MEAAKTGVCELPAYALLKQMGCGSDNCNDRPLHYVRNVQYQNGRNMGKVWN